MNFNDARVADRGARSHALDAGTLRDDQALQQTEILSAKKAFLSVIRSRADIGVHAFLKGRTVIGRKAACSFPLHDLKVSGQHATITQLGDGEFVLEDLSSTNGTRVDGTPRACPSSPSRWRKDFCR